MVTISVRNWQGQDVESLNVSDEVFSVPVREDILTRVVLWQLAKRRSGNHRTEIISDVSGTTRKPFRQKGTGKARQGSLRSPQFRGGAVIFGPVVRDHSFSLPKKVRTLGLRCALTARLQQEKLFVFDDLSFDSHKTKLATERFTKSTLMVMGDPLCQHLRKSVSNLHDINVLSVRGINVYDILRHDKLILSKDVLLHLDGWLGKADS